MRALIEGARARHIFLSYSSEGILSRDEIMEMLSRRGSPAVVEIPYPVFGNGAGVAARRTVAEYLFHAAPRGG
jgi:adenine-specific DNA methylase